ncbi:Caleosin [Amanita rubescens]|nr:Caleosin [Amanita rubescens]
MTIPKDAVDSAPGAGYEAGKENTALQSHVAFFDRDKDGIIWPSDTYIGFRRLGFGIIISLLAVILIHSSFSYPTYGTLLPDPFFRLRIRNIHRGKHGSDTASYTSVGSWDEKRFEHIFDMYSSPPHTHISFWQGIRMVYGNRDVFDPFGWVAAVFEWGTTYIMLWPVDGKVKKEDVKAVYDGSIFYSIAAKREARAKGSNSG